MDVSMPWQPNELLDTTCETHRSGRSRSTSNSIIGATGLIVRSRSRSVASVVSVEPGADLAKSQATVTHEECTETIFQTISSENASHPDALVIYIASSTKILVAAGLGLIATFVWACMHQPWQSVLAFTLISTITGILIPLMKRLLAQRHVGQRLASPTATKAGAESRYKKGVQTYPAKTQGKTLPYRTNSKKLEFHDAIEDKLLDIGPLPNGDEIISPSASLNEDLQLTGTVHDGQCHTQAHVPPSCLDQGQSHRTLFAQLSRLSLPERSLKDTDSAEKPADYIDASNDDTGPTISTRLHGRSASHGADASQNVPAISLNGVLDAEITRRESSPAILQISLPSTPTDSNFLSPSSPSSPSPRLHSANTTPTLPQHRSHSPSTTTRSSSPVQASPGYSSDCPGWPSSSITSPSTQSSSSDPQSRAYNGRLPRRGGGRDNQDEDERQSTGTGPDPDPISPDEHDYIACPFYVKDPVQHFACVFFRLYNIATLKQHIQRNHVPRREVSREAMSLIRGRDRDGLEQVYRRIYAAIFPEAPDPLFIYRRDEIAAHFVVFLHTLPSSMPEEIFRSLGDNLLLPTTADVFWRAAYQYQQRERARTTPNP